MNRVVLIGNLTKNPEVRTTPNGMTVCTFTLAVNRTVKSSKDVDFISIVTWKTLAENCGKYLVKGQKVAVTGRIQTREYKKSNDTKVHITEIIADEVEFLNRPQKEETEEKQVEFEPAENEDLPF